MICNDNNNKFINEYLINKFYRIVICESIRQIKSEEKNLLN